MARSQEKEKYWRQWLKLYFDIVARAVAMVTRVVAIVTHIVAIVT